MRGMESVIFAWIWCYLWCSALEQRVAVTGTRVSLAYKKITNIKRNPRLQPLIQLDLQMSYYGLVEDIRCKIGVTIWFELWSYDTVMTGNIYIGNGPGRVGLSM